MKTVLKGHPNEGYIRLAAERHPDPAARHAARRSLWEGRLERMTLYAALCQVVSLPISLVALAISVWAVTA